MPTRDELKAMVDQLPEDSLDSIWNTLRYRIHPPPRSPETERMQREANDYRGKVLRRFEETMKPGTLGIGSGAGNLSMREGRHFGNHSFNYWDNDALVHQSVIMFNGQNLEFVKRFSFSPDRTTLLCALEIASGGHLIQHDDAFPISQSAVSTE